MGKKATAIQVFDAVCNNWESLEEGEIGAHTAYLMGAILKGTAFAANVSRHGPFLRGLFLSLGGAHPMWRNVWLCGDDDVLIIISSQTHILAGTAPTKEEALACPVAKLWYEILSK